MTVTAVPIRPLKKGSVLRLWLALILLLALAVGAAWFGTEPLQFQTTESGLQYRVIAPGEGPHPTTADVALADYTLKVNGEVIQTTKGQQPVPLPVGGSIPGFTEAMLLMRKDATFRLRIPPQLAYGAEPPPGIPPNATLDFEVTMRQFMPMAQFQAMMGGMGGMPGGGAPQ